jgi:hypothetical protein
LTSCSPGTSNRLRSYQNAPAPLEVPGRSSSSLLNGVLPGGVALVGCVRGRRVRVLLVASRRPTSSACRGLVASSVGLASSSVADGAVVPPAPRPARLRGFRLSDVQRGRPWWPGFPTPGLRVDCRPPARRAPPRFPPLAGLRRTARRGRGDVRVDAPNNAMRETDAALLPCAVVLLQTVCSWVPLIVSPNLLHLYQTCRWWPWTRTVRNVDN